MVGQTLVSGSPAGCAHARADPWADAEPRCTHLAQIRSSIGVMVRSLKDRAQTRRGSALLLSAGVVAFGASCGVVEVPSPSVPLHDDVKACLQEIANKATAPKVCVYFDTAECVFVGPLGDNLGDGEWTKRCPGGVPPEFDIKGNKGDTVNAKIFVLDGDSEAAFCLPPGEGVPAACVGSFEDGQVGTNGCFAQIDAQYKLNDDTGALIPTAAPSTVRFSGFVESEIDAAACTNINRQCEGEACAPGKLNIAMVGPVLGKVSFDPTRPDCTGASCTYDYPSGRCVSLSVDTATTGALRITSVTVDPNQAPDCPGTPCADGTSELAQTHACVVAVSKDGTTNTEIRFGVPLDVDIIGRGTLNWNGGIGGQALSCVSTSTSTPCTQDYYDGTELVEFTATVTTQEFGEWQGCDTVNGLICQVTMNRAHHVIALFGQVLEVRVVGGSGQVTVNPGNKVCIPGSLECLSTWEAGETLQLTAAPQSGQPAQFMGWSDTTCGTAETCTVTMDANKSVRAYFIDVEGGGHIEVPAGREPGDGVFNAIPDTDWIFLLWENCASQSASCSVSETAVGVKAVFGRRVTVTIEGLGAAVSTPAPVGVLSNCGARFENTQPSTTTCVADYRDGTPVRVDFEAGQYLGTTLERGPSSANCTGGVCSVFAGPVAVSQTFGFPLHVDIAGPGRVVADPISLINCSGLCDAFLQAGESINLESRLGGAACFVGWSGCSANGSLCTVAMDRPRSGQDAVVASFGQEVSVTTRGAGTVTGLPSGACSGTCTDCIGQAGTLTLQAAPSNGAAFLRWENCPAVVGPNNTQCQITVPNAAAVTAVFGHEVCVVANGPGTVSRISTPPSLPGLDCGANCCETFEAGTSVTLRSAPDSASTQGFVGWSNCPSGQLGGADCMLTVNTNVAGLTATFAGLVRVQVAGGVGGRVSSNPGSISCTATGPNCQEAFVPGSQVGLSAVADPSFAFYRWTQNCAGTTPSCVLSAPASAVSPVTGEFGRRLTVSVIGDGRVVQVSGPGVQSLGSCTAGGAQANCTAAYPNTASPQVTLEAQVVGGQPFTAWTGCTPVGGTPTQCRVTMTDVRNVTATFGTAVSVILATSPVIGTGGRVIDDETPQPSINCPGSCSFDYGAGGNVDFSAQPNTNWTFAGFSTAGGCPNVRSAGAVCRVNTSVQAGVTMSTNFEWSINVGTPTGGIVQGPGLNCPNSCASSYSAGQVPVRLTAVPGTNFDLYGRTGCVSVINQPLLCDASPTTNNGSVSIVTTFGRPLTVIAGAGGSVARSSGSTGVACSNGDINCLVYPQGVAVNLTATADTGLVFLDWQGCPAPSGSLCSVNLNNAYNVTARFGYALTANVNVNAAGTVTQSTGTAGCGTDCLVHLSGTTVTLTAASAGGWDFMGWQGCPAPSGTSCSVTMTTARTVTANFGRPITVLSTNGMVSRSSNPVGVACTNGNGNCLVYPNATVINLGATPNTGFVFLSWVNCASGVANCQVTANSAQTITANFGRSLNVQLAGQGSITSVPVGINCTSAGGAGCTMNVANGQQVVLTANVPTNWELEDWSANCGTTGLVCTINVGAATTVTADIRPVLTLDGPTSRAGDSVATTPVVTNGTFPCSGASGCSSSARFLGGQSVVLQATGPANRRFVWSGDCAGSTGAQCTLDLSVPRAAQVDFGFDLDMSFTGTSTNIAGSIGLSRAALSGPAACAAPASCTSVMSTAAVTLTYTGTSTSPTWSGDCSGVAGPALNTPCTLNMAGAQAASVDFP